MRRHHRLHAWQQAMQLVVDVYQLTASLPDSERFGLVSQMRRAAVSVPSNIAEGAGRGGSADFLRFLRIARGSLSELETQYLLLQHLGYAADDGQLGESIESVFGQLGGLIKHIEGTRRQE